MPDSYISANGQSFVGPDAVQVYRALVLASACALLSKGIRPNRHCGRKQVLQAAAEITRKNYSASTPLLDVAQDLKTWADTMRLALPTEPSSDA
jgi:hypothetical protein